MTNIKEKIIVLRKQGNSYKQIAEKIPCSLSTVKYYLVPNRKQKEIARTRAYKANNPIIKKIDNFQNAHCRIPVKGFENKITHFNRKQETKISKEMILNKLKEQNGKCYLTGELINLSDPNSYSFDHKIPLAQGGTNSLENLGICASKANCHKYDKTVDEFIDFCKSFLSYQGFSVLAPSGRLERP